MRTVFMGTPEFAVPCLQGLAQLTEIAAVYTQPDRPRGRGLATAPTPVKIAAEKLGVRVLQPERLRQLSAVEELAALQADLIVVVAYAQILPASILAMPRFGCINVHASLLPAYRGGAPIHWAVLKGELETGVTSMLMSRRLDAGDMLLQTKTPIGPDETTGQLHDRLSLLGADLLRQTIIDLQSGKLRPAPQPELGVSYAPNIQKSNGLIDWRRTAEQIHDQVRGLNPWPAAFTFHEGRLLRIWSSLKRPATSVARPGQVLQLTADGPLVSTGEGSLILREVQPESKRLMSGADYARGYNLRPGCILGTNHDYVKNV